ncbi:unnamed protein product [Euphydryas editha]|uniref:Reverse transcriptase n=1 Tax=Euphydryas editha TaxID=104508 RepID=A0AAU9V246_EUPED|nr:unnamed protein product [Euphydryas editha]
MIKNKKSLWREYLRENCLDSYRDYRRINNKIVTVVRNLRKEFERGVVNSGPKSFYSYIRQQLSSTVSVPPSLKDDNNSITNDQEKVANIFAKQFEKSFVVEPPNTVIPTMQMPRVINAIESVTISPDIVCKTLKTFSDTTSMGPDSLPSILLKQCSNILSHQLAHIMNVSLKTGTLPQEWKEAHVTPIYKKR